MQYFKLEVLKVIGDTLSCLIAFLTYQFPLNETSFQTCSICPILRRECPLNPSTGLLYNERKWCM